MSVEISSHARGRVFAKTEKVAGKDVERIYVEVSTGEALTKPVFRIDRHPEIAQRFAKEIEAFKNPPPVPPSVEERLAEALAEIERLKSRGKKVAE